ncbi:MAG: hypothetical protein Udaeo2_27520 [Candidatus Udaeobacter sp.]|nr:MAG: hypothetical protein Udaeo2_27520 [Candidatus Udaeobacter sp.]
MLLTLCPLSFWLFWDISHAPKHGDQTREVTFWICAACFFTVAVVWHIVAAAGQFSPNKTQATKSRLRPQVQVGCKERRVSMSTKDDCGTVAR